MLFTGSPGHYTLPVLTHRPLILYKYNIIKNLAEIGWKYADGFG
jgi:hypothetical protein